MNMKKNISRRDMLKASALATFGFTIVPRHVLGGPNTVPPSEQVTRAIIGVGGMGRGHIGYDYGPLLAVADADAKHLEAGVAQANKDGKNNCKGYRDYREL